ncbi:MAG: galactokinase [Clostridiales bacterium]|nr:galactokinase [Clostridiales bacterium]
MYPYPIFANVSLYEICLTLGLLLVFFMADRMAVKRGFSIALQRTLIISAMLAMTLGFFGAVLFQAFYNFLDTGAFALNETTGMTFYGGLLFGTGLFLTSWFVGGKLLGAGNEPKRRFNDIANIAACLIPLAHGLGRIGCFFAGCCHGAETDAWYGVKMYTEEGWRTVVPVQLFEAAFLFVLAAVLLVWYYKRKGETQIPLLPVYCIGYGIWRYFIEYARADDRGQTIVPFWSPSQLIAVLLIAVGIAYLGIWFYLRNKDKQENEKGENVMERMEAMVCFKTAFGAEAEDLFTAAGRINVIGEHVDYCGGKVFPAALNLRCNIYAKKTEGNVIRMAFRGIDGIVELNIDQLDSYKDLKIGNYQAGVSYFLQQKGVKITPCDLYYDCTVPFGSGLSSSAAIEVATAVAICEYAGIAYDKVELALISQKAENQYAGVNCGIMDQFASAMGKKDHAVLLDCSTLDYEYVPLQLGDYCLVVANCNKPHNLVESKYNVRRQEVETALKAIQTVLDVNCLADVTPKQFNEVKYLLSGVVSKRAEHVVMECDRVNQAVAALKAGNLVELGRLLNESHYSLRDLYEVTGKELDTLSALARKEADCLGSRMIGAGFGGCTISIVKKTAVEGFIRHVGKAYQDTIGYKASFYETSIEDGITVEKL